MYHLYWLNLDMTNIQDCCHRVKTRCQDPHGHIQRNKEKQLQLTFSSFLLPARKTRTFNKTIFPEWGDNAETSSPSFYPIIPHVQTYQDIACRTIVETTGFQKNIDISIKKSVLWADIF